MPEKCNSAEKVEEESKELQVSNDKESDEDSVSEERSVEKNASSPEKFTITVKSTLNSIPYTLQVDKSTTVSEMKMALEIKYNLEMSKQILIYHNDQLNDQKTVEMCGIKKGSTIYIMPKMRAGPLYQKVNAKAVNRYVETMDEEIKEAMKEIGESTGYPVGDDDTFMLSVDHNGEIRLIRITNAKLKTKSEQSDSESENEIRIETWDQKGENQMTRSKMEEIKRKMKQSKEEKIRYRQDQMTKSQMEEAKRKSVKVNVQKMHPAHSNVITEYHPQSASSDDMNNLGLRSEMDEKTKSMFDVPYEMKNTKRVPVMEEYMPEEKTLTTENSVKKSTSASADGGKVVSFPKDASKLGTFTVEQPGKSTSTTSAKKWSRKKKKPRRLNSKKTDSGKSESGKT